MGVKPHPQSSGVGKPRAAYPAAARADRLTGATNREGSVSAHRMLLDVKNRKLIVTCACGQWRCEEALNTEELPSEIMRRCEEHFARHVASLPSPPGTGTA